MLQVDLLIHFQEALAQTQVTNIAMENGPFEDVFPIKNGDNPLLC